MQTNLLRKLIIVSVVVIISVYLLFSYKFFQPTPEGGGLLGFSTSSSPPLQNTHTTKDLYRSHVTKAILEAYNGIQDIKSNTDSCEPYKEILLQLLAKLHVDNIDNLSILDSNTTNTTNTTFLIVNNTSSAKRHLRLFVGILSAPGKFENREGIRNTWVKLLDGKEEKRDFEYKFILGQFTDADLERRIKEEAEKFGDIEFFPITENYRNIGHKTLAIMTYATEHFNSDYVMKMDDDSFLNLPKLLADLEHRPREKLYLGMDIGEYFPNRSPASQWYMPYSEYKPSKGPHLIVGCGYVISKDGVEYLAKRAKDGTPVLSLEDVNTAVLLADANIYATNFNEAFHNMHVCKETTILTHYVPIPDMHRYYKNIASGVDMCKPSSKRSLVTALENDYGGSCLRV